jgi:hypothetical protein
MINASIPKQIKIFHILHLSKLPAIFAEKHLMSDAEVRQRSDVGVTIGMNHIKRRRLETLKLASYSSLHVGECVPFYFCPRSVMLYMLKKGNHSEMDYRGGQEPIIHVMADFYHTVEWAEQNCLRWAFTDSNAGSQYFNDYSSIRDLDKLDWNAIGATDWQNCKEHKQAEFLIEKRFCWGLVEGIGVYSNEWAEKVRDILAAETHKPPVRVKKEWYY